MIRNWYNQIPYPALKTKREITKYINWRQFTKGTRGKQNEQLFPKPVLFYSFIQDAKVTCDGCFKRIRVVLMQGDYTFANMNKYVEFMRRSFDNWFQSLNLKVKKLFYFLLSHIYLYMYESLISELYFNNPRTIAFLWHAKRCIIRYFYILIDLLHCYCIFLYL